MSINFNDLYEDQDYIELELPSAMKHLKEFLI